MLVYESRIRSIRTLGIDRVRRPPSGATEHGDPRQTSRQELHPERNDKVQTPGSAYPSRTSNDTAVQRRRACAVRCNRGLADQFIRAYLGAEAIARRESRH